MADHCGQRQRQTADSGLDRAGQDQPRHGWRRGAGGAGFLIPHVYQERPAQLPAACSLECVPRRLLQPRQLQGRLPIHPRLHQVALKQQKA